MKRILFVLVLTLVPASLFANTLYFPQVVVGSGYSTNFVIWNAGSTNVSTRVSFYDRSGTDQTEYGRAISVPRSGSARFTLQSSGPLTVLWGEVDSGTGTLRAAATIDLKAGNGSLVTTATVLAIEPANAFVFPVDVAAGVSTGVALANVKASGPVDVNLRLVSEDGRTVAIANDPRFLSLRARGHVVDFIESMFPQIAGTTFKGSLVIEAAPDPATNSLAATALRLSNGSLSTLQAPSTSGGTLYFPHVVFGGGYSTTFTIANTGSTGISSDFTFYDRTGNRRAELGRTISVPAAGSTRFTLPNVGPLTVVWGQIGAGTGGVTALATFEKHDDSGNVVSAATVSAVENGSVFTVPVETTATGSTGIAIANSSDSAAIPVTLILVGENGQPIGFRSDARLSPLAIRSQVAGFLTDFYPEFRKVSLRGTLVVQARPDTAPSLVVTALRMKDRGSPSDPEAVPSALLALPRDLSSPESKAINAANAFSLALWAKVNAAERGKNVFVSPLSAMLALGMTMNGAANNTLDEMRAALQLRTSTEIEINEGFRSLMALLRGLDPTVKMDIANSIWYRQSFPFHQSFMDASRRYFDAEVRGLNFADEKASLDTINGWVDTKTNHKIPGILDEIAPDHVMFLINAIYFNGRWRENFDAARTRDEIFTAADGSRQTVPLMHRLGAMPYVETSTYQAVDLPYGNSAFTMTVLLPKSNTDIETFAASLTPDEWQTLTERFRPMHPNGTQVDLFLPKLKLEYERTLNDDLKALGMKDAFVPIADFTRMSPRGRELYIDFVKQKTYVDVHEEGTEAAAVTVVAIVQVCACPPPPTPVMRVDRPYIFAIRERLSGTILFMGKITKMP